jgi:lysophospholipase L1-like esterase
MNTFRNVKAQFLNTFDMASGVLRSSWRDPNAWDTSIRRFEAQDRRILPKPGAIVFTGSSSITFWDSLTQDMAPLPVLNRGFGGSKIGDATHYADRMILPYRPRAVVLYAGTNDIAWPRPASPQQVFAGFLEFVQHIHAALPGLPIYFVSISLTPSRLRYWPIVREANRLVLAHTETDPCLHFIDLTAAILDADGVPKSSLFRSDRLHPSSQGYAVWTAIIKPILIADFGKIHSDIE